MCLSVQVQMKGRDLLDDVFHHLNIVEKDYFGIRYQAETNKMVGTSTNRMSSFYHRYWCTFIGVCM